MNKLLLGIFISILISLAFLLFVSIHPVKKSMKLKYDEKIPIGSNFMSLEHVNPEEDELHFYKERDDDVPYDWTDISKNFDKVKFNISGNNYTLEIERGLIKEGREATLTKHFLCEICIWKWCYKSTRLCQLSP